MNKLLIFFPLLVLRFWRILIEVVDVGELGVIILVKLFPTFGAT